MRVALISDIHANEIALRAVLRDIELVGVDRIVCLGDTATLGPRPHEVLEILEGLGCTCIVGNHDEFLLDPELIRTYSEAPPVVASVDWCRRRLSADELRFLRSFVRGTELELGENCNLLLFHGSPRSHMEDILATTPPEELDELLDGRSATVMAGGHTHLQMMRQHRGMLLVNPGSVGMPFREYAYGQRPKVLSHAEYATVEATRGTVNVTLRRVHLDKQALHRAAAASDNPLCANLQEEYS